jgi:hypothetical protein
VPETGGGICAAGVQKYAGLGKLQAFRPVMGLPKRLKNSITN